MTLEQAQDILIENNFNFEGSLEILNLDYRVKWKKSNSKYVG
jgi:hypothetical protein